MNELVIRNAIQQQFANVQVRAKETGGGWLLEVIHPDVAQLSAPTFRRRIEQILAAIPNPNPPFLVWKLFVYAAEGQRYLQQGTLHTLPESVDNEGITTTTLSGNDAYMDIPEFDAEFISFNEYNGHVIPAVESIDGAGNRILEYKPVQYDWLEAMGGHYPVAGVTPQVQVAGARQVFNVELD